MTWLRSIPALIIAAALAACGGGSSSNGGPDAAPSGSCSLVGTWNVTGSAGTTWTGRADGSATLSLGGGAGTVSEAYAVMNGHVGFNDIGATGAGTSQQCAKDVVGIYTMAFAASCNQVTFTLVDDACAMRAQVVNGLSMTK
jgi:hypothetical protein